MPSKLIVGCSPPKHDLIPPLLPCISSQSIKDLIMEKQSINSPYVTVEKTVRLSPADFRCIDNALRYVDKHYAEKISADSLSLEVGLSKDKLQAGLQRCTGKTLHKYIQEVRMTKAKELLITTNDPLKSVADASGYANESHFCKVFKKINIIIPLQYRFKQIV